MDKGNAPRPVRADPGPYRVRGVAGEAQHVTGAPSKSCYQVVTIERLFDLRSRM